MTKKIVLVSFLALMLGAQTVTVLQIPVWTGARYIWAKLGQGFVLNGTTLEVRPRTVGLLLVWDSAVGGYRIPAGANSVAIYVNGFRYVSPQDYTIVSGVVVPGSGGNWPVPAEAVVVVDFDGGM